jgi:hypothetical protein
MEIDVSALEPGLGAVDLLARLQLAARRGGCRLHFRNVAPELRELVAYLGLTDVLDSAMIDQKEVTG